MRIPRILLSLAELAIRLRTDERGTVAVIMGVVLIPLVGALGIGFEVSNWYMITRGMQNAADAAALAAATNGGGHYDVGAQTAGGPDGVLDWENGITVNAIHTPPRPPPPRPPAHAAPC